MGRCGKDRSPAESVFIRLAGNWLHCPKPIYGSRDWSARASAISTISGVGEKPSSAGARTACASALRPVD